MKLLHVVFLLEDSCLRVHIALMGKMRALLSLYSIHLYTKTETCKHTEAVETATKA